jgi:hypothetical protein
MYILHKNDNNTNYQTKEVQKIKCMDVGLGSVTTLALGSWSRQGFTKVWAKNETQDSHFVLPGV